VYEFIGFIVARFSAAPCICTQFDMITLLRLVNILHVHTQRTSAKSGGAIFKGGLRVTRFQIGDEVKNSKENLKFAVSVCVWGGGGGTHITVWADNTFENG
jgi:hypothetical protein